MGRFGTVLGVLAMSAGPALGQTQETVTVSPGTQVIITVKEPFTQLMLGSSDVADALPKSETTLVIQGKKVGVTDLLVMHRDRLIHKVVVAVGGSRVYTHSDPKGLHSFTSYECNPVCVRVKGDFESAPAQTFVVEGGGPVIITPPAPR